ncbi:hypothetical protein BaRGS_00026969 [Batillaria attramentaria]|uniref:Reverse transcriptase domain-containing protein n=2 Tax=Batillaria attramentaria TaxID=370345 RepID=A0ABD0K339_9CAEN
MGPHRTSVLHANLLKRWVDRPTSVEPNRCAVIVGKEETESNIPLPNLTVADSSEQDKVHFCEQLQGEDKARIRQVCENFKSVFDSRPGRTHLIQHRVNTITEEPCRQRPYPIPLAMSETVGKDIDAMLEAGLIRKSESCWAAPIVLIKKGDGTVRMCVDYRRLNSVTVADPYPMPRIQDILARLGSASCFSKLDLTKGYYQIPLHEDAIVKSAFVTPGGHYEFLVMPFGMRNAAATFMRLMDQVLNDVPGVFAYMDDVLAATESIADHSRCLVVALERLKDAHLTAKPEKCFIAYPEVEFLGFLLKGGLVGAQEAKEDLIQAIPVPATKKAVRSFLGLVSFYRNFIPHFSAIAAPLSDLTKKTKPNTVVWTQECEEAFVALKNALVNKPVLHTPDMSLPFVLQTDASDTGLGAVLLQVKDSQRVPVEFRSRKLNAAEARYSTVEKECLAIVWATSIFRQYLLGRHFLIESDHQPLSWLSQVKDTNRKLLRWSLELQEFDYEVKYVRGEANVLADALSRLN